MRRDGQQNVTPFITFIWSHDRISSSLFQDTQGGCPRYVEMTSRSDITSSLFMSCLTLMVDTWWWQRTEASRLTSSFVLWCFETFQTARRSLPTWPQILTNHVVSHNVSVVHNPSFLWFLVLIPTFQREPSSPATTHRRVLHLRPVLFLFCGEPTNSNILIP